MKRNKAFFLKKLYKLGHGRGWSHNAQLWPYTKIWRDAAGVICRFRVSGAEVALTPYRRMFPGGVVPGHIILSGPSIRQIDYSQLALGGVMGVNGAIRLRERYPEVEFSHYCIIDEHFVESRHGIVAEVLRSNLGLFVTPTVLFAILRDFPLAEIRCRVCVIEKVTEKALLPEPSLRELKLHQSSLVHVLDSPHKLGFSLDPEHGLFDADTVAYAALQLLAATGVRSIYFHGLDLSAPGPRFYESANDVCASRLSKHYHRYIEPSFRCASALCREKGIQVYNLSMTSVLPDAIIPKVNWRTLAKASPCPVASDSVDGARAGLQRAYAASASCLSTSLA